MPTATPSYEIAEGGLLRAVEHALHLVRGDRRDWWRCAGFFVLIIYAPMLVVGVGWRLATGAWGSTLSSLHTHVRPLVTIPLLLLAEPLVDARARGAGAYVRAARLISAGSRDAYDSAIARTAKLRDCYLIEVALFALALATSFLRATYTGAASLHWANEPAIVLYRFLLLRWIWRWLLWGVFLWRVSRLPLSLRATHPDRLAGLGPLLGPAYAIPVVATAVSVTLAAAWAEPMIRTGAPPSAFYGIAVTYVALVVVLVLLPACVFIPALYRVRKGGLGSFGAFANRFVQAFEDRWSNAAGTEALGAPDISSLADLGGSYTVVNEVRVLPWTRRLVVVTVVWSVLPMLPLALIDLGLPALLQKLAGQLL